MNAAFRTGPVELPSRTGRSRSVATCRSSGRSGGPSVGQPSHERSPRARIARSRSMVPGRRTRSGTVISSLAAVSVSIEHRRLSVAGSTAQESSGLFWSRPMGSAFAAKVSGASSGQCRSLGATRRHAAIARSVPPEAAYRGPTRSVDRGRRQFGVGRGSASDRADCPVCLAALPPRGHREEGDHWTEAEAVTLWV